MNIARRLLSIIAAAVFSYACYWSLRLAYADHVANLEHAIRLAPINPGYYLRLADTDQDAALAAVTKAAALNPMNSSSWIHVARVAEDQKDFQRAESCLLHAVELDKTFAPRWILEDYYFRRRDQAHFWPAMRAALATSYDDVSPLFESCWTLASNPETILQQAIPDRAEVLRQYLDFLLGKNRLDLAAPVASKLIVQANAEAASSLLNYCDRALANGQISAALPVWNSLAKKHLVPYPQLSPEDGRSVTNSEFAEPFLARAFDWRLAAVEGVSASTAPNRGVHFTFSGKQPEYCELLSQYVPLASGRKYRLRVKYDTEDLEGDIGIVCHILDPVTRADLLQDSGHLMASECQERKQEFVFSVPPNRGLGLLALTYGRVLGTVRISGSLSLRQITLGFTE